MAIFGSRKGHHKKIVDRKMPGCPEKMTSNSVAALEIGHKTSRTLSFSFSLGFRLYVVMYSYEWILTFITQIGFFFHCHSKLDALTIIIFQQYFIGFCVIRESYCIGCSIKISRSKYYLACHANAQNVNMFSKPHWLQN